MSNPRNIIPYLDACPLSKIYEIYQKRLTKTEESEKYLKHLKK